MSRLIRLVFVLAAVMAIAPSAADAQTRIKFKKGARSSDLDGNIPKGAVRRFLVHVRKGQTVWAHLGNQTIDFIQPGNHLQSFTVIATRTGDIPLTIDNHGSEKRYKLTVHVE